MTIQVASYKENVRQLALHERVVADDRAALAELTER